MSPHQTRDWKINVCVESKYTRYCAIIVICLILVLIKHWPVTSRTQRGTDFRFKGDAIRGGRVLVQIRQFLQTLYRWELLTSCTDVVQMGDTNKLYKSWSLCLYRPLCPHPPSGIVGRLTWLSRQSGHPDIQDIHLSKKSRRDIEDIHKRHRSSWHLSM